jgi:hypothetical protein
MDGRSAQIAGAAGRFGERDKWGPSLPFPLAPVWPEGANSGHSPNGRRTGNIDPLPTFLIGLGTEGMREEAVFD